MNSVDLIKEVDRGKLKKMSVLGNSQRIATYNRQNVASLQSSSRKWREGQCLLGFRRESRRGFFELKFIGKKEFEVVVISHWLQAVLSALLLGREESSFFKKSKRWNSYGEVSLLKQFLPSFFSAGYEDCNERYICEPSPFLAPCWIGFSLSIFTIESRYW